jgi:tetratricopeptide (TPR) repeat protein
MAKRFRSIAVLALAACASAPRPDEGLKFYEAGEFDKALECYSASLKDHPENAEAYYRRACCRMHLMDRNGVKEEPARQAIEDLDRAVELAPDDYRAYYARAMAYAALARFKEAAHDLLVCVQSQDKSIKRKAHLRLGQIFDEKFEDMEPQALKHFEAYLQMGGTESRRYEELKKAELERSGAADVEQVQLKALEQAKMLAKAGRHADSLDILARILTQPVMAKEPLQEARELYMQERLAVEAERKAEALFETASGMIQDGKLDVARGVLEELVKKYPTTEAARSKAPAALLELLKKSR